MAINRLHRIRSIERFHFLVLRDLGIPRYPLATVTIRIFKGQVQPPEQKSLHRADSPQELRLIQAVAIHA
jgi:hypothetical protein